MFEPQRMQDEFFFLDEPSHMQPTGSGRAVTEGEIVVTAYFHEQPWFYDWGIIRRYESLQAGFLNLPGYNFSAYTDTVMIEPTGHDEDINEVKVTIKRALTPKEQEIIEKFMGEVAAVKMMIDGLSDGAYVIMPNGTRVLAGELKEIWAKTDFTINAKDTLYSNGSTRSEADYNDGDPKIAFNLDLLTSYVDDPTAGGRGGFWVIMHEVGHMTADSRSNYDVMFRDADGYTESDRQIHERYANDFARVMSDNYTGQFSALFHISDENPYSATVGSVFIPLTEIEQSPANIPWWKFNTSDGSEFINF